MRAAIDEGPAGEQKAPHVSVHQPRYFHVLKKVREVQVVGHLDLPHAGEMSKWNEILTVGDVREVWSS